MAERYLIIGGNAAGMSAAFKARRLDRDADIVVYEAGGEISVGACGIPYYVAGEFDSLDTMRARTPDAVAAAGIELHLYTKITAVDSENQRISGISSTGAPIEDTYTKLLIATGANPIVPPLEGVDLQGVYSVKSLVDAETIRKAIEAPQVKRVTVVGGGFIGIEMVESALHLGKEVQLIEMQDSLMPQPFDTDVITHLESYMRESGVTLSLGESLTKITGTGRATEVTTSRGTYPTDMVILALGVRPATELISSLGVEQLRNGAIVVNRRGESSIPNIFAAGDCAAVPHRITNKPSYVPLATTANKLGRVVGEVMAGGNATYPGSIGSGSFRFREMEAVRVGVSEKEALAQEIPYKTLTIEDKNHTNYVSGSGSIWVKVLYDPKSFTLLGAQLIGALGAELRSYPLVVAIEQGLSIKEFALADFPYAPPFSRTWDILNIVGSLAK